MNRKLLFIEQEVSYRFKNIIYNGTLYLSTQGNNEEVILNWNENKNENENENQIENQIEIEVENEKENENEKQNQKQKFNFSKFLLFFNKDKKETFGQIPNDLLKNRGYQNSFEIPLQNISSIFIDSPQNKSPFTELKIQNTKHHLFFEKGRIEGFLLAIESYYQYSKKNTKKSGYIFINEKVQNIQIQKQIPDSKKESNIKNEEKEDDEIFNSIVESINFPKKKLEIKKERLSLEKWQKFFNSKGQIKDPDQFLEIVFLHGINKEIRKEIWKFLLGYFPLDSTLIERLHIYEEKEKQYNQILNQWINMENEQLKNFDMFNKRKSLIEFDVLRSNFEKFDYNEEKKAKAKEIMKRILISYSFYNYDLGYGQGMSEILLFILNLMENEVDTFWCFKGLMDKFGKYFILSDKFRINDLRKIRTILKFFDYENYKKILSSVDAKHFFFCIEWILILFIRVFSDPNDIYRLWEAFFANSISEDFHLFFSFAIIDSYKNSFFHVLNMENITTNMRFIPGQIQVESTLSKVLVLIQQISEHHLNLNQKQNQNLNLN
ncbi:rabgap/tbc domain-containing protein [Anaeramoeba ignava]|uniref:Rabgap/tbc domain-containing protein n=1 Tax=Anaeramoeba ignava TaxID=1746090 RepID=A0A9Q0LUT9_ANAIG|nr:rabgap/tbc domain-containing protein [Anaeramoeba ignava]